jgi:crotonobetainyl-CoA:carnitine CoA-transferase CaiB-like acyl-CoA transferase
MTQIARNETMETWGFLKPGQYLIHDRDGKYCPAFQKMIDAAGVKRVPLPPRSPNLNAYAERWVKSVKSEVFSKLIVFGERERAGGAWPVYPSSLTAQAADGRFVAASSASWEAVCSALERLGMPRPADVAQARHALERLIGARPADEAVQALRRAGLPASPVNSVADLVREPHLWSRGNLVRLSDPERGEVVTQGVVPRLGRTPGRVTGYSPYPGSDNDAVFGGILGYSPQQIRCLTAPVPPDVQR